MNVVQTADINKAIDGRIDELKNDPAAKQSVSAAEVAEWGIELLEMLRHDILQYQSDVRTRRYRSEL